MRRYHFVVIAGVALFCTAIASADIVYVTTTSPVSGSIHTNGHLHVSATSSSNSGYPATGWVVGVKNTTTGAYTDIYNNPAVGSSLISDICFSEKVPQGNYTIFIKAWDSAGTEGQTQIDNVNLSGACVGSPPTVPGNAILISGIDAMGGWTAHTGDVAGCPAGQNCNAPVANYTDEYYSANSNFGIPTLPGSDGKSAVFTLLQSPAWADLLYGKAIGASNAYQNFKWGFWVYLKATTYNNLEFDFWQSISQMRYMMGSQCNTSNGTWDGWNEATQSWIHIPPSPSNNNLACGKFAVNQWHHIVWYFNRSNGTYGYVGLTVDGVYHPLETSLPRYSPKNLGWSDNSGVQVQIDADGKGDALTEWIDKMNLWMW